YAFPNRTMATDAVGARLSLRPFFGEGQRDGITRAKASRGDEDVRLTLFEKMERQEFASPGFAEWLRRAVFAAAQVRIKLGRARRSRAAAKTGAPGRNRTSTPFGTRF